MKSILDRMLAIARKAKGPMRKKSPEPVPKGQELAKNFRGNAPDMQYTFPGMGYLSGWDTPEAFYRHINSLKPKDAWCDSGWEKGNKDFYGTKDMDTSMKMAIDGWPDGIAKVERLRDRVLSMSPLRSRLKRYDIVGSVPNVPRAVAGDPKNMLQNESAFSKRRPVITLISNMGANWSINEEMITNRAAVVAAMIDHIEAAGYACEVITCAASAGSNSFNAITAVRVKEPHQPVDIGRLSFSLGQSSMFRRLVFADWGSAESCRDTLHSHLGSCYQLQSSDEAREKSIYVVPSLEGFSAKFKDEDTTATQGLKFLINSLKEQGCPAFISKEGYRKLQESGGVIKDDDPVDADFELPEYDDDDD